MLTLLLYTAKESQVSSIILLVLLSIVLLVLVVFLFLQIKKGKELKIELSQLDNIKENNILNEFVLKALRIATWHMDIKAQELTYDSDYRDSGNGWIADAAVTNGSINNGLGMLHEQDAPRVAKSLSDLCEGIIKEYHEEYRVRIPNSDKVYWEESYSTVAERDVDGKATLIVGTSKRIDERKNMESALVEARNRAEESDRLKSAFIANMSHEIRTPLNAIVGFTSVLPDISDEEERKMLLNLVHENTQKLLLIIDDVVNISKIEAGEVELVLMAFDICPELNSISDQYRNKLKPGVTLNTEFASDSQIITTDPTRLMEIMKHLIDNAVKFTNEGSVTVGFTQPTNGRIHIFVRDTGIGVEKSLQERIFERFFKVDEFIPGAGLGLSICRTMAFSMGGNVYIESAPGKGSTLWLEIPMQ